MNSEETKPDVPIAQEKTQNLQQPKPPKPKEERQANCLSCGKPIKKLKRYYRNGKFYCNKKCWRKVAKPKEAKEAKE
jgi:hypothetical protein